MLPIKILPLPVPIGWGRGWGHYNVTCSMCGGSWVAVAAVGGHGGECPYCRFFDDEIIWESLAVEHPNDGAWLTGRLDGDF